jgi:hypothetical protein
MSRQFLLRPGLRRRRRLVCDQRHQQCKIQRKLLLRSRSKREEALQARILPAAEVGKADAVISPQELPNTTTTRAIRVPRTLRLRKSYSGT